jgi:hypothetical protein
MNDARNVSIRHFILVEKEKDPENWSSFSLLLVQVLSVESCSRGYHQKCFSRQQQPNTPTQSKQQTLVEAKQAKVQDR